MSGFADWRAICETKARYCRCLDTKDWAGYADCFTEDFVLITPPDDSRVTGRDAAVAWVRARVEPSSTVHQVHNSEISFTGPDVAAVIWAMQDRNTWDAEHAAATGYAGHTDWGHYHERYRRCTDGQWRIAESRLSYLRMDRYPLPD